MIVLNFTAEYAEGTWAKETGTVPEYGWCVIRINGIKIAAEEMEFWHRMRQEEPDAEELAKAAVDWFSSTMHMD